MATFNYPTPKDWQRFQLLAKQLLEKRYGMALAELGRPGQDQHGTDLLGTIPPMDKWSHSLGLLQLGPDAVGKSLFIQCKHTKHLTLDELIDDYKRAVTIDGIVTVAFLVATTHERDANLQLDLERKRPDVPFFETILFWDDFERMLDEYRDVAIEFGYFHKVPEEYVARMASLVASSLERPEFFREQFDLLEKLQREIEQSIELLKKQQQKLEEMMESASEDPPMTHSHQNPENDPDPMIRIDDANTMQKLLDRYTEALFGNGIGDSFSKSRRERKFFLRMEYESFFKQLLGACTLSIDEKSPRIDEAGLQAIRIRALGILATVFLKRADKSNTSRIKLEMEIDPLRVYPTPEEEEKKLQGMLFEWAKQYRDFKEKTYDRELLELDKNMPFDKMYDYMTERFGYATVGMKRLVELTELKTEMLKRLIAARESDPALYWTILVDFAVGSVRDIIFLRKVSSLPR